MQMDQRLLVLQKQQEGLRAQSQTLSCPVGPEPQSQTSEASGQRRQTETITHFHIKELVFPGFQTPQLRTFQVGTLGIRESRNQKAPNTRILEKAPTQCSPCRETHPLSACDCITGMPHTSFKTPPWGIQLLLAHLL